MSLTNSSKTNAIARDSNSIEFPLNFKFGAASASYQVEGAWNVDGRGPSIWDTFTHNNPEKIADKSNGDDAALSYYQFKDDVAALKAINAQFYRFSISWSRIFTNGEKTTRNNLGFVYYNNLINELLAHGIEPMVTMYHWDMPQPIQDLGGLMNPLFVDYFEEYANALFEAFGDRVKEWITFNEPQVHCNLGYADGIWPPGLNFLGTAEYICAHHIILAHARVYHLYKEKYSHQNSRIGITLNAGYAFPEDPTNPSHAEARDKYLQFHFGLYAHPLIHGDYPAIVRETVDHNSKEEGRSKSRLLIFDSKTVDYVKGSTDFIGLNYYSSVRIKPAEDETVFKNPSFDRDIFTNNWKDSIWPKGASSWMYSVPEGLYQLLLWVKNNYNNTEVQITENGWSDRGELNDVARIEYFEGHYDAVHRAIQDGCYVTAHAAWSIIDNFEWLLGYTEKFGIYRVDIKDPERKRVAKSSVKFFKKLFKSRQLELN